MSLAEKTAYAEKLEELLRVKLIKIAHYDRRGYLGFDSISKTIYSCDDHE
jgi:hypothetical protein